MGDLGPHAIKRHIDERMRKPIARGGIFAETRHLKGSEDVCTGDGNGAKPAVHAHAHHTLPLGALELGADDGDDSSEVRLHGGQDVVVGIDDLASHRQRKRTSYAHATRELTREAHQRLQSGGRAGHSALNGFHKLVNGAVKNGLDQCVLVGDRKPFIAAIITLNLADANDWLKAQGAASVSSLDEAVRNPIIRAEVKRAVDKANALVSRAESIRTFRVLATDFTE